MNSQLLKASQDAFVTAESAIIYADQQMTSPIGHVKKGKKIKVGDKKKYQGLVYPVVVSGRIAYVRVKDLSLNFNQISRFQEKINQEKIYDHRVTLNIQKALSTISLKDKDNGGILNGDRLQGSGFSLKGEKKINDFSELQVLVNYFLMSKAKEKIDVFELGVGGALRILNLKKALLKFDVQALLSPYSSYTYESKFKLNSTGISYGAGPRFIMLLYENIGLELSSGYYVRKLSAFEVPKPYNKFEPSFSEWRVGVGLNVSY